MEAVASTADGEINVIDDDYMEEFDEDGPAAGRAAPKKRKGKSTRWKIPAQALGMLEQVFLVDKFPSVETRKQLAANLKVTPRQVQVWFQNKRQRAIHPKSPEPEGALGPSVEEGRAAMGHGGHGSGGGASSGGASNSSSANSRGAAVDATLQQRDVFAGDEFWRRA